MRPRITPEQAAAKLRRKADQAAMQREERQAQAAESRWGYIAEGYTKGRRTAARYACSLYRVLAKQASEDGDERLSLSLATAAKRCDRIARGLTAFRDESPRAAASRAAFEDWLIDMRADEQGQMVRLFSELVDRIETRCARLGVEYATRPEHEQTARILVNDRRLMHVGNDCFCLKGPSR